jgi:hypothetical protein
MVSPSRQLNSVPNGRTAANKWAYLLVHELFENLSALTIIISPLSQRPGGFENVRAAWMLCRVCPVRSRSVSSVILKAHPRRQPALAAFRQPRFEPLRGVAVRTGRPSGGAHFSIHAAPVGRLFIPHGPLGRTGRDQALDLEVKVGDRFGVPLRVRMLAAPGIRPLYQTRACFIMCTVTVDEEGRWRLSLRKQETIKGFTCSDQK